MSNTIRACTYVEKGGVGKTTTAAHLGVAAAQHHDVEVALVDLAGTQNDLATQFGLRDRVDEVREIEAVFGDNWDTIVDLKPNIIEDMTLATGEGPDLIPSSPGLDGKEANLTNVPREERFSILDEFVTDQLSEYDFVLIDLPGKEDNIALNGLHACEHVVAPLVPGAFEIHQIDRLAADLDGLLESYGANPRLSLVLPNRWERRQRLEDDLLDELEETYPDELGPVVRKSRDVANHQREGRTLVAVDENELLSTAVEARDAFAAVNEQLLEAIQNA